MRYDRLNAVLLGAVAALLLLTLPGMSSAAEACSAKGGLVDCACIQNIPSKESFKINNADLRECINRGWSAPTGDSSKPGSSWVPDEGKGPGITTGGAGGFSYGAVKAPESPPGSRNENASVSDDAINRSCYFPPRITFGSPPSISFPAGSCLDFLSGLFKDNHGTTTTTTTPTGVSGADLCPADSNNAGMYGVKNPATGSIAAPCGAMVPIATAELTLNLNPTNLATTTSGSYYIWAYRKSGNNFAEQLRAVALPSYLCGATDSDGFASKSVDLTPPTEQFITYQASDGFIAIRLQPRSTMPSTYIPRYVRGEPEKFLVLPLDGAGEPIVPRNCARNVGEYFREVTGTGIHQDLLVQSELIGGTACASVPPTMVNYPSCSTTTYSKPRCTPPKSLSDYWIPICNPSNPPPPYDTIIKPDASGGCFLAPSFAS